MGSVYGKIVAKPSYFLVGAPAGEQTTGFQRRLGLPPPAAREPTGVVISLESLLLDKEKFDPATDSLPVHVADGGFPTALIGAQVGTKLVFENGLERPLALKGVASMKDAIEPKGSKTIAFETPGVYVLTEPDLPGAKLTVVITSNPYVIALDETGEFLFESLEAGKYTLKVYTRESATTVPLEIKADQTTKLVFPLVRSSGAEVAAAAPGKQ